MLSKYVNYGCGFSVGPSWENFDSSPTLRLERMPIIGVIVARFSGNANRFPSEVKYGDIRKGPLVAENTAKGVYASHVLEHLSYQEFEIAIQNTFRMLEPGGEFRLLVPDLHERASRYMKRVEVGDPDASSNFMRSTRLGMINRPYSLLSRLRQAAGGSAHLWMWDEISMRAHLSEIGFVNIRRCAFGDSSDAAFSEVEDYGRFHDANEDISELAISAIKPA